jgi:chromatin segregation and condensation protein Rec8/ScpA/Scc1 (kleisin family)
MRPPAPPLQAIVEQLALAVEQAPAWMPLGQKTDWVVMASWILLLRSNLTLPQKELGPGKPI